MKRLLGSVLIGSLLVGWVGMAQAQEGKSEGAPKKEPPRHTKMECEIVSVDATARTIEVKSGDKTEKLVLSEKCKIKKDGKEAALADLKAGEKCTCTVYEKKEGPRSVGRIVVGEDKEEKKKE